MNLAEPDYSVFDESSPVLECFDDGTAVPDVPPEDMPPAPAVAISDKHEDEGAYYAVPAPVFPEEQLPGVLGDIVRRVMPYTEVSAIALYLTLLNFIGFLLCVPNGPYIRSQNDNIVPNMFLIVCGPSGRGVKGRSLTLARRLLNTTVLKSYARFSIDSGEGLIRALSPDLDDDEDLDVTVSDFAPKKVAWIEEELSRVLKKGRGESSTLLDNMRRAFDGRPLENNTKREKMRAENYVLGFLGHVTPSEFRSLTNESSDIQGGTLNRIMFCYSTQSKELSANSEGVPDAELTRLQNELSMRICKASEIGRISYKSAAAGEFDEIRHYERVVRHEVDNVQTMIDRSIIYQQKMHIVLAALDGSPVITKSHVRAAQQLAEYWHATIRHLLSSAAGEAQTELERKVLEALRARSTGKMKRSELQTALGKKKSSSAMDHAINSLTQKGRIRHYKPEMPNGGRPPQIIELI